MPFIRQQHDRRRLAHVFRDLNRRESWGLGQRGSRGTVNRRKSLFTLRQRATGRQEPNQVVPTMTT
jgi:hypothetical protein